MKISTQRRLWGLGGIALSYLSAYLACYCNSGTGMTLWFVIMSFATGFWGFLVVVFSFDTY